MKIVLLLIQVALILVIAAVLWQIWQFLKQKDIPEDEPLGEQRAKYLTDRLNVLQWCLIVQFVLFVIHCIAQIADLFWT